ncbi:MAG: response regulator transcription factor [Sulfurovaceae bacterium]|nr:response regulator transcription factor [Sulfurovaceae bacterium]
MNILLVEDNLEMQKLLTEYLENYGYDVKAFDEPMGALDALRNSGNFDLVILDLMLPKMDGFDVCKTVRGISDIPIIISSARGNLSDKMVAFEYGADDYLAKPYEPKELILRIDAIFRRINRRTGIRKIGEFQIDEHKMEITHEDYVLELTKIEYEILSLLLANPKVPISRETIANYIGADYSFERAIDMHISNIRNKLFDDPKNPKYIKSIWGVGYKFIG